VGREAAKLRIGIGTGGLGEERVYLIYLAEYILYKQVLCMFRCKLNNNFSLALKIWPCRS